MTLGAKHFLERPVPRGGMQLGKATLVTVTPTHRPHSFMDERGGKTSRGPPLIASGKNSQREQHSFLFTYKENKDI